MRYLRFIIPKKDPDSLKPIGLIQALSDLKYDGRLTADQEKQAKALFQWFNRHLRVPKRFTTSRSHHGQNKAISWFKASALRHIAKMREIALILEDHNVIVKMAQTDRPGYITQVG